MSIDAGMNTDINLYLNDQHLLLYDEVVHACKTAFSETDRLSHDAKNIYWHPLFDVLSRLISYQNNLSIALETADHSFLDGQKKKQIQDILLESKTIENKDFFYSYDEFMFQAINYTRSCVQKHFLEVLNLAYAKLYTEQESQMQELEAQYNSENTRRPSSEYNANTADDSKIQPILNSNSHPASNSLPSSPQHHSPVYTKNPQHSDTNLQFKRNNSLSDSFKTIHSQSNSVLPVTAPTKFNEEYYANNSISDRHSLTNLRKGESGRLSPGHPYARNFPDDFRNNSRRQATNGQYYNHENGASSNLYPHPPASRALSEEQRSITILSPAVNDNRKKKNLFSKPQRKILTDWAYNNLALPYPTSNQKEEFIRRTGLDANQINNWFTNFRKRNKELIEQHRVNSEAEIRMNFANEGVIYQ